MIDEIEKLDLEKCHLVPSRGGLSASDVKDLAKKYGISDGGLKAELCTKLLALQKQRLSGKKPSPPLVTPSLPRPSQALPSLPPPLPSLPSPPPRLPPLPSLPSKPLVRKPSIKNIQKPPESTTLDKQITKSLAEVLNLMNSLYDTYKCCEEHYSREVLMLKKTSKKFLISSQVKQNLKALEEIQKTFLDPFMTELGNVYHLYLVYFYKKDTRNLLKVLNDRLYSLAQSYMFNFHRAISKIPLDILLQIYPPTAEYPKFVEHVEICEVKPSTGVSYLNCISTYFMQSMTRYVMATNNLVSLLEKVPKDQQRLYPYYNDIKRLANVTTTITKGLNEFQRYLDSLLYCSPKYCDEKLCEGKGRKCKSKLPHSFGSSDWYSIKGTNIFLK